MLFRSKCDDSGETDESVDCDGYGELICLYFCNCDVSVEYHTSGESDDNGESDTSAVSGNSDEFDNSGESGKSGISSEYGKSCES